MTDVAAGLRSHPGNVFRSLLFSCVLKMLHVISSGARSWQRHTRLAGHSFSRSSRPCCLASPGLPSLWRAVPSPFTCLPGSHPPGGLFPASPFPACAFLRLLVLLLNGHQLLCTSGSSSLPTPSSGCPVNASGLTSSLSPGPKPEGSAPFPHSQGPPAPLTVHPPASAFSSLCLWPPRPSCCHGLTLGSLPLVHAPHGCQCGFVQTNWWLPGTGLPKHNRVASRCGFVQIQIAPRPPVSETWNGLDGGAGSQGVRRLTRSVPAVWGPTLTYLPPKSVVLRPHSADARLLEQR